MRIIAVTVALLLGTTLLAQTEKKTPADTAIAEATASLQEALKKASTPDDRVKLRKAIAAIEASTQLASPATTIDLAKQPMFDDGPIRIRMTKITCEPGKINWTIEFEATNTTESMNIKREEWTRRFSDWKTSDDSGREYPSLGLAVSPGDLLVPTGKVTAELSINGRPGAKVKEVYLDLKPAGNRDAIRLTIPVKMLQPK